MSIAVHRRGEGVLTQLAQEQFPHPATNTRLAACMAVGWISRVDCRLEVRQFDSVLHVDLASCILFCSLVWYLILLCEPFVHALEELLGFLFSVCVCNIWFIQFALHKFVWCRRLFLSSVFVG